MSEENKQAQGKDPLDQAINQIKESASKALQAELKTATDEYIKARTVFGNAKQKVVDVIQRIEDNATDFAGLKKELKA